MGLQQSCSTGRCSWPPLGITVTAVFLVILIVSICGLRSMRFSPPRELVSPGGKKAQEPQVERNLNITAPDVAEAQEWLSSFFAAQHKGAGPPAPQQQGGSESWWQQTVRSLTTVCGVRTGQPTRPKRHLLLATVGDQWGASRWLSKRRYATFDVAAIYYGSTEGFKCKLCSDVFLMRGPKWLLYYNLTTSPVWEAIMARGYKYIMLPDDDLIMNTCQLNTFFSVLEEFDVLLGQPSVCERDGSFTYWSIAYQRPQHRLRFTTFVEIMAPTFRADFFQAVIRHTLNGTHTGWGLDYVWPALLRYPKDKIAMVDQICMVHPPSPPGGKPGGLYSTMKQSAHTEMSTVFERFNYKPEVVKKLGQGYRSSKSLKTVPNSVAQHHMVDIEQHMRHIAMYQVLLVVHVVVVLGLVGILSIRQYRERLGKWLAGDRALGAAHSQ